MVGIIFFIVITAPKVGLFGERLASFLIGKKLTGRARCMSEQPTLFVTDPTAEVARISMVLQTMGYILVDLPLSRLISRLSSQIPALILADADADGILEIVHQVRAIPGGEQIEVILFGEQGKTLRNTTDAVLAGASGFLPRPLDLSLVLRKVQSLVPLDTIEDPNPSSGHISHTVAKSTPPAVSSSRRPSVPEEGTWDLEGGTAFHVPQISAELEEILSGAEARVRSVAPYPSEPPSPEEEVNVVLPRSLLEVLEEPLSEDEFGSWSSTPANTPGTLAHMESVLPSSPAGSLYPLPLPPGTSEDYIQVSHLESPDSVSPLFSPGVQVEASTRIERAAPRLNSEPPVAFSHLSTSSSPISESQQMHGTISTHVSIPAENKSPKSPESLESPVLPEPVPVAPIVPLATVSPVLQPATPELPASVVLEKGDSLYQLAKAVAERLSGVLCFDGQGGLRRIVLRDGDLMTASSSLEEETLGAFLVQRGDLPHDVEQKLRGRLPPFGRHAGAALIAHGYLSQDRLWEALRSHAEWLIGKILLLQEGICQHELEATGRLRSEPAVFGGSTGAEILVEIARRVLSAEEALEELGGWKVRLGEGKRFSLLNECSLDPRENALITHARGFTVSEILADQLFVGLASVLLVLERLGILEAWAPSDSEPTPLPPKDDLDEEALRARVRARLALVEEGDYFAVLGIPRRATPYEIRRAYLELRRSFEPSRILSSTTVDLAEPVRTILEVLDEAFEVLRDGIRRERYRRAIEARPPENEE